MAESLVQVAPDSTGKKLHAWDNVIGGATVLDEFTVPGEYPYATYVVVYGSVSIATANDHILTINAGASLKVRIRRIRIDQGGNATTAAASRLQLVRTTTTAPTGGTAGTVNPLDTADAAAGATSRSIPAVKGTETAVLYEPTMVWRQAVSATGAQFDDQFEWTQSPAGKPIVIPAGTTNGIAVKNLTAIAAATVSIYAEFVETNF